MRRFIPFNIIAVALLMAPLSDAQASSLPDFDGNGVVDFPDFLQFVGKFGSQQGDNQYESGFDLDGDGAIGFSDFLIFVSKFGKNAPLTVDRLNFPLRALHVAGNWATNETMVNEWESAGRVGRVIPSDYIEWLNDLYVDWVGISVALFVKDSLDSMVERVYPQNVDAPRHAYPIFTFSDEALRQIIRELREHGFKVYITLAFEDYDINHPRHVRRWTMGNPYAPRWWPAYLILPEDWPWSIDHPDHERFVAEFWETYTQQAVHFARLAQEEGVQMYSLGTETDYLFRTRSGDRWPNHFGKELKSMVERVRSVYDGLLTYDMHIDVFRWPHDFGPGSDHLWEDLDLDIIGFSAWFSLVDTPPTTPMSVETAQKKYEEIFNNYLIPITERNPNRPVVFTEYGAVDVISAPAEPGDWSAQNRLFVFTDLNGNGKDDGRETQANMYHALINTMDKYPGVVNGVFYWDNWITTEALWMEWWAGRTSYSIRGKPAEEVVRVAYQFYMQGN